MTRTRRRALRPALLLAVLLALLVAACGDDGGGNASPPDQGPRPADTDEADKPDDEPAGDEVATRDAGLDLPRSTTFGGAELAVTGAVFANAEPSTFGRGQPTPTDEELLFLELTTRFVDGFPGTDSLLPVTHFVIETADGTRVGATGVDFLAEVPVAATADTTVVLGFEVDEDALDGAKLVYDDGERLPAVVPLTGEVPEPAYPIREELGEAAAPELATGCDPSPADVTLEAVEWDVDAGVGRDGEKLARGISSRATVGHRWLRAELEVTARAGQCGGTFANHETFRVLADGTTITPVNADSYTLADGQSQPMTFLFEVPVDTAELALEVGRAGARNATFALDLPDLPEPGEVG